MNVEELRKCGRGKAVSNYVNLAGKRFGRLKVMYPTEKRDSKGSVYWHCICDCGKVKDITEASLVHGNYRSCGCLKAENQKNIYKKLHMVDGTCVEILEKRKHRRDNKSGFRGVYQKDNGKYRVSIGFKGRRYNLGCYRDYNDAVHARLEAEQIIYTGFLQSYREWELKNIENPEWGRAHPLVYEVDQTADHKLIVRQ